MKRHIFLDFSIFFKIYKKIRVKLGYNIGHWDKNEEELECNINSRCEEIKKKNYLRDKEKAFELKYKNELQHIASLRKQKQKTKIPMENASQ